VFESKKNTGGEVGDHPGGNRRYLYIHPLVLVALKSPRLLELVPLQVCGVEWLSENRNHVYWHEWEICKLNKGQKKRQKKKKKKKTKRKKKKKEKKRTRRKGMSIHKYFLMCVCPYSGHVTFLEHQTSSPLSTRTTHSASTITLSHVHPICSGKSDGMGCELKSRLFERPESTGFI
jgi:hypothetical protein